MNQMELLQIVEQYSRNAGVIAGKTKVIRVQDSKTIFIETIGDIGRSIFFREYQVDGKMYWAGYSPRSDTVFVSEVSRG